MQPSRLLSIYELKHPPEKVWRALTESELIAGWLMPNDFKPVVGHHFTFRTTPRAGWDGVCHCEVLAVDPPHHLRYSWCGGPPERRGHDWFLDTTVTWTLTRSPSGGTRLRLDHEGFKSEQEATYSILKSGWSSEKMRTSMARVVDGLAWPTQVPTTLPGPRAVAPPKVERLLILNQRC